MEPNEGSTKWHQHPRAVEGGSFDEEVPEGDQALHRAELGHDRREDSMMREKVVLRAKNAAEK